MKNITKEMELSYFAGAIIGGLVAVISRIKWCTILVTWIPIFAVYTYFVLRKSKKKS